MDTLTAIFTRRSTRHFEDRPIEDDKLRTILEAAMSGPSCVNSKDWAFIVVTERKTLDKMAEAAEGGRSGHTGMRRYGTRV